MRVARRDAVLDARSPVGRGCRVTRTRESLLALAARVPRRFRPQYAPEAGEHRLTSGMRLLLAATALALTSIAPPATGRPLAVTYGVLAFYIAHAAAIYLMARIRHTLPITLQHSIPWVDLGVCAVLMAVNGWRSAYFVLCFFGILVASLRWGIVLSTATTIGFIVLLSIVGYMSHGGGTVFDFDHAVMSAAVVGYMIVFRGAYQQRLRHRLRLLRDIGTLSNPRFGPNRMLARSLERLREFYDADLCVAVLPAHGSPNYELRRATRARPDAAHEAEKISPQLVAALALGDELVCFRRGCRDVVAASSAAGTTPDVTLDPLRYRSVAELLGALAYLTVPLRTGATTVGRLYVAASDPAFDRGDAEFLLEAADKIMPLLTHIDLVERMATRAAEDERHRIALDIHDRLIQPYVGLQMGIGAVRQLISGYPPAAVPAPVRERMDALANLSELGIQEVRHYTRELRDAPPAGDLVESLRRFSCRFHEATGIQVALDVEGDLSMDVRLASEIYSMACEAVSNVRRHTSAPSASIRLRAADQRIVLRVENPAEPDGRGAAFVPHSIAERAAAIDGTVRVEVSQSGGTAVVVEIPL